MKPGIQTSEFSVMAFLEMVGAYALANPNANIQAIGLIGMFAVAMSYIWTRGHVKASQ
jgi:hypothetical protein